MIWTILIPIVITIAALIWASKNTSTFDPGNNQAFIGIFALFDAIETMFVYGSAFGVSGIAWMIWGLAYGLIG